MGATSNDEWMDDQLENAMHQEHEVARGLQGDY